MAKIIDANLADSEQMADIRKRLTEYLRELHLPTIRRKFEEEARRAERATLSYIADMKARDRHGRRKYGRPLTAHNGRDALQDAYEEALDLAVYLKQAIVERDADRRKQ